MAYMDYMDPDVLCPQKRPINLISLSLSKLIMACRLCVIYMKEDKDSNV